MKEFMGYPIVDRDELDDNTNGWVKEPYVSEYHKVFYPETKDTYTLFIEGEVPTTDCEGSDCCMVGTTLWWGLHKIEGGE